MDRKIDRFDKYMKAKGLNDNKVTLKLSLSVGTLGKSRKEGRDLSDRVIEQILNNYTDINKVWLLTGVGEMLKNDFEKEQVNTVAEPSTKYNPSDPVGQLIKNNTLLAESNSRLVESNAIMLDSVKVLTDQLIKLCSNEPPSGLTEILEILRKEIKETIKGELKNTPAREDVGCADVG